MSVPGSSRFAADLNGLSKIKAVSVLSVSAQVPSTHIPLVRTCLLRETVSEGKLLLCSMPPLRVRALSPRFRLRVLSFRAALCSL